MRLEAHGPGAPAPRCWLTRCAQLGKTPLDYAASREEAARVQMVAKLNEAASVAAPGLLLSLLLDARTGSRLAGLAVPQARLACRSLSHGMGERPGALDAPCPLRAPRTAVQGGPQRSRAAPAEEERTAASARHGGAGQGVRQGGQRRQEGGVRQPVAATSAAGKQRKAAAAASPSAKQPAAAVPSSASKKGPGPANAPASARKQRPAAAAPASSDVEPARRRRTDDGVASRDQVRAGSQQARSARFTGVSKPPCAR